MPHVIMCRIYKDQVAPLVKAPLEADDLEVGSPKQVEPYHAVGDARGFWRVPLVSKRDRRVVGHFDVRQLDVGKEDAFRIGKLPRRDLQNKDEIKSLPLDTLEMTPAQVREQVKKTFGAGSTVQGEPKLVFDGAEPKVAWKVEVKKADETFTVFVTPGYAYRASKQALKNDQ